MRTGVQWFTALVQAGLETRFLTERDVLVHATPSVLIASLPREVLVGVFDTALGSGKMTPESIVTSVTTETLVEHAPPGAIWSCLAAAAERRGLATAGASDVADAAIVTEMLRRGLSAGLSLGAITPGDVVREVTPKIVLAQFPDALTLKLLEASLTAGVMNAGLVIDTLGAEMLAKHAPVQVWACIAVAGYAISNGTGASTGATREIPHPPPKKKPQAETIDDIASVLIELDDPKPTVVEPVKPPPEPVKHEPVKHEPAKTIIPEVKPVPPKQKEAAKT